MSTKEKKAKKEEKEVEKSKTPENAKEIKKAKKEEKIKLDGVLKYKNGYSVVINGKVEEVCPGVDGFAVACKRYKLYL